MKLQDYRFDLPPLTPGNEADWETGRVAGISAITLGEAQGHGVQVDEITFATLLQSVGARRVKVKLNHWSGVQDIVGYGIHFRIDRRQVRFDLEFDIADPRYPKIAYLMRTMPAEIGISIAFRGYIDTINDREYIRVRELRSVDIVDDPAANPSGLFSRGVDNSPVDMAMAITLEQFDAEIKPEGSALEIRSRSRELVAALLQERDKLASERDALRTERDTLKAESKTAEERANELLDARGIKPIEPDRNGDDGDGTELDTLEKTMLAEKDPVKRTRLYRQWVAQQKLTPSPA